MTDRKTPKNLKVTPVSDWKKDLSEGSALELPSGKVAQLRRRSIFLLMKTGQIPNELRAIVQNFISSPQGAREIAGENFETMFELIDLVAKACFVYPKLVDEDKAELGTDEIYISDIEFDDKLYVYLWSSGEVSDLGFFRREQDSTVSNLLDGQAVQPEAE